MKLGLKRIRLWGAWLSVPVYLVFARPTADRLLAGATVLAVGCLIRAWAAGTIQKDRVLTTGGPYAYTRNPLYLGTLFVGLGVVVAGGQIAFLIAFLTFFAAIYGRTMLREQKYLENIFGEPYREYARTVPLFVPRLRVYRTRQEPEPGRGDGSALHWPAPGEGFSVERYRSNREYQVLIGAGLSFLALVLKLVLDG
jgi:protein-S-isoprenylcysteine O-methyltransferase Ste14